jgi:plastocyanin
MRLHLQILIFTILSGIAVVGCATNPTALITPTPTLPATAVRSPTPAAIVTITYPTRVAVPIISIAPDLTALRVKVEMANFRFNPSTITARAGQPIRLELQNNDILRHNFTIDDSDIDASALPGFSQRLDFVISKPGTYVFACNLIEEGDHRSAGMMGTLIVEPAP